MKGSLLTALARFCLSLRYRVTFSGLEDIPKDGKGALFLPNHPALIDPVILLSSLHPRFQVRTLADKDRVSGRLMGWIADRLGVAPIPDPAVHGEAATEEIQRVIHGCSEGLEKGEQWMLYPAGRIYRSRMEDLGGNSAVESILARCPETRVVLVRTSGLWGSAFSRASGSAPDVKRVMLGGMRDLLLNFLFFGPRREVHVYLEVAKDLPVREGRAALNRALEAFYNSDPPRALYVPRTLWECGGSCEMPEPAQERMAGDLSQVSPRVREQVLDYLHEISGRQEIGPGDQLARDLGLDSLARMELQNWLEQNFGFDVPDPECLFSVGDCLLAACGGASAMTVTLKAPPAAWFRPCAPMTVGKGVDILSTFLAQAQRDSSRIILADQNGVRSYRDIITALFVMRPCVEKIPGAYVGIMLPASQAAAIAYLAVLAAGKTPVMINWTVGERNLAHGLEMLHVDKVLSAKALISKLESQGMRLPDREMRFLCLEDLFSGIKPFAKVMAAVQARLCWTGLDWVGLRKVKPPEIAAVLFTSGSESLPKAVPLTHANLLANVRDISAVFDFCGDERMVGFLPPFHSFGLTATLLLPLLSGLSVVYHANPLEASVLARVMEAYRVTLLAGTPTFLAGIVRVAKDEQLATLRWVVSGAEKCPDNLFEVLGRRWPSLTVLEGYGITECSPVVSVNRPEHPVHGSIGKPLACVEHSIVDVETRQRVKSGAKGLLLLRGESIFHGYLHHDGPSPFEDFEGRSWYCTGDLVREDAEGILHFAGRLKRFVKLGGEMISLPSIEEALLKRFALESDEEQVLAVEAASPDVELALFTIRDISREQANDVLKEAGFSPLHFVRQVRRIEKIPVLGTGKIDYRSLKEMLAEVGHQI